MSSAPSSRRSTLSLAAVLIALVLLGSSLHHVQRRHARPATAPSLSYRAHLEATTSPESQRTHSPTLTFDHIYVLSLPTRLDRREQMTQLAHAHGLELTFVDAANKHEPFIRWIAERAVEVRSDRLKIMVRPALPRPLTLSQCSRS